MSDDLQAKKLFILEQIANDMMTFCDEGKIIDPELVAREHAWLGELERINEELA